MIIYNESFTFILLGVPGEIVVKFRRAPGPGVLDLDFDCDTLVAGVDHSRKRMCKYFVIGVIKSIFTCMSVYYVYAYCFLHILILNPKLLNE